MQGVDTVTGTVFVAADCTGRVQARLIRPAGATER